MTRATDLLAHLCAAPATSGLFLDFDGTLTPIVEDPTDSRLPDGLAPVIGELATRLGVVAVVSGRPASFLADRVQVDGVRLLGLYGLEEWRDGAAAARPEAATWQAAVDEAKARLHDDLDGLDGVHIEDKGLSVAVHWRNAPDRDVAAEAVSAAVTAAAEATRLGREPGKLVDELRPPVDWDKGSAVRAVSTDAGLQAVAYLGDDLGDLAAFAAVRELGEAGGLAVAVDHGEETPREVRDAADLVLDGPPAVTDLLGELLEQLRRGEG
jgi:trehalose 6-phosphate phosphatase